MERKHWEYPKILYCDKCKKDVEPSIEDSADEYIRKGQPVIIPYKIAVCKTCGSMLCNRDLDEVILAMAREDGLIGGGKDG